jgi:hypothetical protein
LEDPIDAVLVELKNRSIDFDNRLWSSAKVVVNGIKRLWDPQHPGIVTGEWDPAEHDPEHKGAAAVKPRLIELPESQWNWYVSQISTMLAQTQPILPCNPDYGMDFFFEKTSRPDKGGGTRIRYENPGFLYVPSPVVADPSHLAAIKASLTDLDAAYPPVDEKTIQTLNEVAGKLRAHYQLTTGSVFPSSPPVPQGAAMSPPVPGGGAPPPAAGSPAAAPPPVSAPAAESFWFNGATGVFEVDRATLEEALAADPTKYDQPCVMSQDKSSGWVTPSSFGIMPPAAVAAPPAAAPAASPPPPSTPPPLPGGTTVNTPAAAPVPKPRCSCRWTPTSRVFLTIAAVNGVLRPSWLPKLKLGPYHQRRPNRNLILNPYYRVWMLPNLLRLPTSTIPRYPRPSMATWVNTMVRWLNLSPVRGHSV